jgi:2,5-diketo-D-gluconate reductase B
VARIGQKHGKTAAQVALRWLVQQPGVAAIPKATGEANLRANLEIFDFSLVPPEVEELNRLTGNTRIVALDWQ